jgi:SAM-dependent methyltransferase
MTVFGPAYADAYDALYSDKDYVGECNMIEALIAEYSASRPRDRLLDLGCGTGSHAIALATRGYDVTGIDRSPMMLARARKKAGAAGIGSKVGFYEGDVRSVRLAAKPYDAAIMMFAVLGYQQTDDDVRAALVTARAHLAADRVFLFDVWYGPGVLFHKPGARHRVVEQGDMRIVRRSKGELDEARHVCIVKFDIERWRGEALVGSNSEDHVMRFFFPSELDRFAAACGFVGLTIRAFPRWEAVADDRSWNVVCVWRAV